VVRLPVAFVNGTREALGPVAFHLGTRADLRFGEVPSFGLEPDARARRVLELTVGPGSRAAELALSATAGAFSDVVTRPLAIVPRGFPVKQEAGGQLEANGAGSFRFTLAPDTVAGSVETSIEVYPSPAGNLAQALKRLIQEPSGCFEQTSSTTYPLTMALQYFESHSGAEPAVVKDAQDKLDRGYQRLVGYECKKKGYEWFGEDPGHEALTAYGLLQFTDMQKVRAVDPAMLANTRAWLLAQRDGKGGFERRRRALHVWVEDRDASDAYITWALLEAGATQLGPEVQHVEAVGLASRNTYVVALAANVAALARDQATTSTLLARLGQLQGKDGLVTGATGSIVGSQGRSLDIETTALAALAWLRPTGAGTPYAGHVQRAMKALAEASTDGSYGATQSTVLALRAVLENDRRLAGQRRAGTVRLLVDGRPLGKPVKVDPSATDAVSLPDAAELLGPGSHTLELRQEGGGVLPWTASVSSHRVHPESAAGAPLTLEVTLPPGPLGEGDVVEAVARLANRTDAALPTVVAIVGLPGGLEPRHDALKELVKQHTVDAYEVRGRDVVLYWRGMTPGQQLRVPVSLVAAVPGRYAGPASRAYPYYTPENKTWAAPLEADIAARN
jgi:alpha-2-macroglobulin-like protein